MQGGGGEVTAMLKISAGGHTGGHHHHRRGGGTASTSGGGAKGDTGMVAILPALASAPLRRLFDLWLQQLYHLMSDFENMEPLQVWGVGNV